MIDVDKFIIILVAVCVILSALVIILLLYIARKRYEQSVNITRLIKKERENAITMSRRVVKGHLAETMFPLIQKALLGYELGDMLFIGKLVDYIIVDGYSDAKDNGGEIKEIIFLDVKTGNATLSKHQESLKKAIEEKRVKWLTARVDNRGKIHIEK